MKKIYTIGRDSQCDIVINDSTDVVSRLHATIKFDGSKMYLIDQSQNGTYVNGMRMSANEEIPVTRTDTISFANVAELDWNQLPNPKAALIKTALLATSGLLILGLFGYGLVWYFNQTPDHKPVSPTSVDVIKKEVPDNNSSKDSSEIVQPKDSVKNESQDKKNGKNVGKTKSETKTTKDPKQAEENNPETETKESDIPLY